MKEALKLALEALEDSEDQLAKPYSTDVRRAITAIKEALREHAMYEVQRLGQEIQPEQIPPSAYSNTHQPEQEPVAFICEFYADEGHPFVSFEPVTHGTNTPLYSTPPQRKPLTDEEIILIVAECAASHQHTDIHFARAIERAHGIKELV